MYCDCECTALWEVKGASALMLEVTSTVNSLCTMKIPCRYTNGKAVQLPATSDQAP